MNFAISSASSFFSGYQLKTSDIKFQLWLLIREQGAAYL